MPSSVRRLTALDHERLVRLLRRMCTPGPGQDRWRAEFVGLLRAHRHAERDVVIGELVADVEQLAGAARDQAAADVALDELAADAAVLAPDHPDLDRWAEQARLLLDRHSQSWAESLMVPLEGLIARRELRRLGGAYETRREEELSGAGVAPAPPRRLDLSRAELYELARRAGIEGRSSMTRGQLIDELQRHQGEGPH
jgi:hypothetical protein